MHTSITPTPVSDIGFVMDRFGDLISCRPIGTQMRAGCGFVRDSNGDINFDSNPITNGFVYIDANGDMRFRIT